jgi:hypothetical protein
VEAWRRATARAESQGGAITHDQLIEAGLSSSAITRRCASGDLHPRHIGVYALGRPGLTPYGETWAATLAAGDRGAAMCWSAAAILGVASPPSRPQLLVVGGPLRLDGVTVRRTRRLHPDEVYEDANGLRFTWWPRMVTDLAARSSVAQLQSVLDGLERRELLDLETMAQAIRRARGRHGLRKLRRALEPYTTIPDAEYDSLLERLSAMILHPAGLGDHEVQGKVTLSDGRTIRVDILFRRLGLAVEMDGRRSHGRASQWGVDKHRDRELQKLGISVLRFTWQDVKFRPEMVVRDTRTVLEVLAAAA